ncbi:MAG: PspA/IM30 family protein [Actinomycetota bacterium]|nr:PspA/IM30 family protein [Actinomycetota bacterium]
MRRLSTIFRAKATKAVDAAENPNEMLDYSYERQLEMLQKMRRGLTDVAASRKRVELQAQGIQKSATKLEEQARRALAAGREDLAREALLRREGLANQVQDLRDQHEQLRAQEEKLVEATRRLETKIQTFRTKKETLKASYTAAEAQTKVNEAISGVSEEMGDVGLAMQRAEDKVAQMQARSEALDQLLATGALEDLSAPGSDSLDLELNKATSDTQVELELSRLKGELEEGESASQLEAGEGKAKQ